MKASLREPYPVGACDIIIILLGCELVVSVPTHGQHGGGHSVEYHGVHRHGHGVLCDDVLGGDVVNTSPRKGGNGNISGIEDLFLSPFLQSLTYLRSTQTTVSMQGRSQTRPGPRVPPVLIFPSLE